MKISFALSFFPKTASGGCKVIFEYANYLVQKGHEVSIYMTGSEIFLQKYPLPEKLKKLGQRYIVERSHIRWFELDSRVKRIAVEQFINDTMADADIVFATAVETAQAVASLAESKGKKCYLVQDFENWNLSDEAVYKTYALGMKNIVVSKWLEDLVDKYSAEKSILIGNAINTDVFKRTVSNDERVEHSIIFHYRSEPHKGCQYALETIRILKEKYPDLVVYVVSIEKEIENLPDYFTVMYNLNAEQIAAINNKARIFMCSSVEEGFGLPGLEGMACGCALVTTDYKGATEYAKNGINALISSVRKPEDMAENIVRLFEDDALRKAIVQEGIKTAQERSLLKNGNKLERVLLKMLDE